LDMAPVLFLVGASLVTLASRRCRPWIRPPEEVARLRLSAPR